MVNHSGAALLGTSVEAALKPRADHGFSNVRTPDGRALAAADYPLARAVRGDARTNEEILIEADRYR